MNKETQRAMDRLSNKWAMAMWLRTSRCRHAVVSADKAAALRGEWTCLECGATV